MPICDGYEASSIIRKSEPNYLFPPGTSRPPSHLINKGIPIIAVTANSHEKNRQRLVESGIGGLISLYVSSAQELICRSP